MKGNNLIQMNKFSKLHDENRVVFCKIDNILQDFQRVSNLTYNVIMLVMNGDNPFTDNILKNRPHNVKHIFATNSTVYNEFVTPIPIGIENSIPCKREGHGSVTNGVFEKLPFLENPPENTPKNKGDFLYSNFNTLTNLSFRNSVKQISLDAPHINWEYGVSYQHFVNQIKNHKATLSPRGNGIECIRTYEVLYLNEIPVCIGDRSEYNAIIEGIYKYLPIVFIDNLDYLRDIKYIDSEIKKIKNNSRDLLDIEYWENKIIETAKKVL